MSCSSLYISPKEKSKICVIMTTNVSNSGDEQEEEEKQQCGVCLKFFGDDDCRYILTWSFDEELICEGCEWLKTRECALCKQEKPYAEFVTAFVDRCNACYRAKLFCGTCQKEHKVGAFAYEETLNKDDSTRRCMRSQGSSSKAGKKKRKPESSSSSAATAVAKVTPDKKQKSLQAGEETMDETTTTTTTRTCHDCSLRGDRSLFYAKQWRKHDDQERLCKTCHDAALRSRQKKSPRADAPTEVQRLSE